MPTIQYNILSSKNNGLPLSASELEGLFFFGISIKDKAGNKMSESKIEFNIKNATEQMEGLLNIKMVKQVIQETEQYNINDYQSWGFVPTTYPVSCAGGITGFLGKVEQVIYPKEWISHKKSNDGISYWRSVHLIPTSEAATNPNNSVVYSGISPHMGHYGSKNIPNYWNIKYVTSFDRMPEDILMAIGKLATINIFAQLGDIILGAGIASQSIGLDGLSQSISTTSSATSSGYGSRIIQYQKDLKESLAQLQAKYKGFTTATC